MIGRHGGGNKLRYAGSLSQNLRLQCLVFATVQFEAVSNTMNMKKDKIIYWITTSIICAVMVFSIFSFTIFEHSIYPEGAFAHLKLPGYFKVELTIAKTLGVLSLLLSGIPARIKEFTYFGFGITITSAIIAHWSVGDDFWHIIDPFFFLMVLSVSYWYYHKLEARKRERQYQ
jgi:hypothetical protein